MTLAALVGSSATAEEIYRWTDKGGEVHYTNDLSTIPAQARERAVKTDGAEISAVPGRQVEEPPASKQDEAAQAAAEAELRETERQWRETFRAAIDRVDRLEQAVRLDKAILSDPGKHGIRPVYGPLGEIEPSQELEKIRERLRDEELDLAKAREALHDLELEAARKAIPLEWRH